MFRSRIRWLLGTMMVWRYACLRKKSTTTVQAFSRLSQARQGNARLDRLYPCRSTGRLHAPLAPIDHRSYFGTLPSTRHFSTQNDLEQDNDHYHGSSISTNGVEDHVDDTALRYWMDEHGLNAAQGTAVTQPLAAITRVVAGPGSGKTRVLTCRIAHLLETAPRERVLAVTFTRKAAGEMQKRLERLLQEKDQQSAGEGGTESPEIVQESDGGGLERSAPGLDRVTLGTFHSVCGKMLRWNGDLLATLPTVAAEMAGSPNSIVLDGSYVIIDQAEQLRVLKECLVDADINLNDHKDIRPFSILNAISTAKSKYAEGGQPFKKERTNKPLSKIMQITSKVYPFYRQRLFSSNCVDFDDLIFLSRELLMAHGDVRERLQRRWSNILVDEFQDTSKTQMDLIKLLTSSSLFVVGDADQSIYSWRGAHVGSLNDLETEFRDYLGGVRTVYLMENYRSTSNIVKAAQKVISSSEGDSKSNQLRQDMKPKRGAGPAPRVIACADDKAEADFVVKLIKEQVDSGEYTEKHEAALIYRTNAQSRALEEACVQRNLPYVVFGSATSFYKRQEIKDSLCFLRWLYNGMDRGSMLRAFKTPAKGLGDKALQEFDSFCQSVEEFVAYNHPECTRPTPLDMLLLLSEGDKPAWAPNAPSPGDSISTRALKSLVVFSQQMRALRTMAYQEPVDVLVGHVVESFNLLPHLDKVSKSKGEFEERKANIQELLKATQRYAKAGPSLLRESDPIRGGEFEDGVAEPPLGTFLDDVALVTDMADQSLDANEHKFKVCLMTIHASKGMEFDTVFVVGNEDGTFPSSQAIMEGDGSVVLEEEKRLCYVAMTRAKTELVMTWRKEVPVFTSVGMRYVKKDRSRFLNVLVDGKKGKTSSGKEGLKASSPASTRQKAARSIKGTNSVFSRGPSSLAASARRRSSSTASGAPSWQTKSYTDSPVRSARYEPRSTSNYQSNGANSKRPKPFGTTNIFSRQRSELARQQPSTPPYPKPPPPKQQIRPPDGKEIKSSSQVPNQNMDSTWFFPVGSKVKHVKFGEGIVLNPPSARSEGDMPVLVKFPDGERREFSAHGRDLSPVFV